MSFYCPGIAFAREVHTFPRRSVRQSSEVTTTVLGVPLKTIFAIFAVGNPDALAPKIQATYMDDSILIVKAKLGVK